MAAILFWDNCHDFVIFVISHYQPSYLQEENRHMLKEIEPAATANDESTPESGLGTILVVEDDPRMQKVLRRIFAAEHYSVVVAGDGQTGLELFQSERPLAVVLDLILPQISGRELCQKFKSLAPEVPVVV